jgi:hypothetical protein
MRSKGVPVAKSRYLHVILASYLIGAVGCSPASMGTTEGLYGTALGAAAGTGVGLLFAQKVGNTAENVLINGAIGAGAGLLAGALLHEQNVEVAREREVVQREARLLHENEREIAQMRRQIESASSWGQNETQTWAERYPEDQSNLPYQGPAQLFP